MPAGILAGRWVAWGRGWGGDWLGGGDGIFWGGVGHCGGVGRGWAVQGGFNICFCVIFCFLTLHFSILSIFPNIVSLKLFNNS